MTEYKNKKEQTGMSIDEMNSKIMALNDWEQLLEEAKVQVENLKDEIKAEMAEREVEELLTGNYIVRWTSVLTQRFDSTAFKKEHGDLYKQYTKQVSSRRFTVSA